MGGLIDSGLFPSTSFTNEHYRDGWFKSYGPTWFSNDEDAQRLFYETAMRNLHDEKRLKQLRKEERHNRSDFRRTARKDYREAKEQYRDDLEAYENGETRTPPKEPIKRSYYDTDAGRARQVGRDHLNAYLAYRDAYDAVDKDLARRGMYRDRNAGVVFAQIGGGPYNNLPKGFVMRKGFGQKWVDNNREMIESGDPYFIKLANLATGAQQKADAEAWDKGLENYPWKKRLEAIDDQVRSGEKFKQIEDRLGEWKDEYIKLHGRRPVVSPYPTYHFSNAGGDSTSPNSYSRGGRLRVPKRNSYGDRLGRADGLGTDDYDVYF